MFANVYYNAKSNKMHYWEYDKEGNRTHESFDYKPYAFIHDKEGDYKDLHGHPCKIKHFSDWFAQKDYVKGYNTFEGDIHPECRFVVDHYFEKDLLSYIPKLHMHIVDIETVADRGFPKFDDPLCEIHLISVYSTKTNSITTFGTKEYHGKLPINYVFCQTEEELLKQYFKFHRSDYPDILSGWFCNDFDFPYIIQRATFLLGDTFAKKYSPVNDVRLEERERTVVKIGGITILDYMELYDRYSEKEQDSYRLDYIAEIELKDKKLAYEGTLEELYNTDFYRYVEYNVKDVFLVKKLHDLFDFINNIQIQSYMNKVPFDRVPSKMRQFDGYLMTTLKPLKIVMPTAKQGVSGEIPGGFVKEIRPGYYPWVATYDYTSLYPSVMFALNLSPEMYVGKIRDEKGNDFIDIDLRRIEPDITYKFDTKEDDGTVLVTNVVGQHIIDMIVKNKYTISANGVMFRTDKFGFVPTVVKNLFDQRKIYKKKMIQEETFYVETKEIEHNNNRKRFDAIQRSLKDLANAIYGCFTNKGFRFFSTDFARAITLTGQKINMYTTDCLNQEFKKRFGTNDVVVASDTDSFMLDISSFVNHYKITKENYLKAFTLFDEKIIKPYVDKCTLYFSEELIHNEKNWFNLKKEVVSDGTVFIEKKKYAMRMIEKEGVKYNPFKMKFMGIEIVRSSTPSFCRDKIKEVIINVISEMNKEKVREELKDIRKEFFSQDIEKISFPRSVNGIKEYSDENCNATKGCPIQVRAALNYNRMIKKLRLENKYNYIRNGDKIKFIYVAPSPMFNENIIGFIDKLPKEFKLHTKIDFELQFEKSFMSPIQKISNAIKWGNVDLNQNSLEELF